MNKLVRSWSGCVRVWSAATLPTASRPLGVLLGVSRVAVTSRLVPVLSKSPVYQPFRSLRHVSAKLVSEPSGLKTRGHVAVRKNPTSDIGQRLINQVHRLNIGEPDRVVRTGIRCRLGAGTREEGEIGRRVRVVVPLELGSQSLAADHGNETDADRQSAKLALELLVHRCPPLSLTIRATGPRRS